jgi:hypothetical protein
MCASERWGANSGDDGEHECGDQFVHDAIPIKIGQAKQGGA